MELLRKPVSIVWAALMLATIASTWLLSNNSVTPEVATWPSCSSPPSRCGW